MSDGLLFWNICDADFCAPEPSPDDEALWMADPRPLTFEEWCALRFGYAND
jgi:hypothetical protein